MDEPGYERSGLKKKKGFATMNDVISKAILSGLGFASLTRDAIRETAQVFVKQSKLSEQEGRRLVKEFQHRSLSAQKTLEKKVDEAVRKAIKSLDLAPSSRSKKSSKSKGKGKGKAKAHRKSTRKTKA